MSATVPPLLDVDRVSAGYGAVQALTRHRCRSSRARSSR